jgi:PAS domain S-box-containing protein
MRGVRAVLDRTRARLDDWRAALWRYAPGRRDVSIREILLAITGGLTLLIVLLCARDVYADSSRLGRFRELRDAAVLSDTLFFATNQLSLERDLVMSMLHARDPDTASDLEALLVEARHASDRALDDAERALDSRRIPDLDDLRARVEEGHAAIRDLRPQVDAATRLAPESRDPALAVRWYDATTEVMSDAEDLWFVAIGPYTNVDAVVTQHLRFKHVLRTITDYTGRERSIIGQIISEDADPAIEQTAALLHGQGVLELSWRTSRLLAVQSGLYPSIAAAYSDAESHYATLQDMSRGSFYVPGARLEGPYPIGPDLWFELSSQAAESLDALRAATRTATNAYLDGLIAGVHRAIAVQAFILLAALAICGYSIWVILRQVIRPINRIVEALVVATRGGAVRFALPARRADEIGKLSEVLDKFQSNVDEIQRTAAELHRSQARLRAVVDNAVDGLVTMDAQGSVVSFNPACERIFGYRAEDILGRNVGVLIPDLFPTDPEALSRYVADVETRLIGETSLEASARRKDGSAFPIDLTVASFALEDGAYTSAIVRDVTARKRAETTLMRYTRALERTNRELDDFAYIASHDLKEPLRGIANHSLFLLEDNEAKLDEESGRRLHRLIHLSRRMELLVNDLLGYSRLGRLELQLRDVDIAAVVHDIEDTLEHLLEERGARIVRAGVLPVVVCDQTRVVELYRNLIVNAVKYSDKPETIVEVGVLPTAVSARGAQLKNVLYVKDNGPGIDPQFHQEVFRIFKRLKGDQEDGTGVGLTFAKKIVERHGGEIWISSRPGEGATFYFTLEADRGDAGAHRTA